VVFSHGLGRTSQFHGSRAMAAHTRVAVGYNAQIAGDTKHKQTV
jgi:hypothetical protein